MEGKQQKVRGEKNMAGLLFWEIISFWGWIGMSPQRASVGESRGRSFHAQGLRMAQKPMSTNLMAIDNLLLPSTAVCAEVPVFHCHERRSQNACA